jgi:nitrite reductase/ring-hydroxylating ferredoxin subunit
MPINLPTLSIETRLVDESILNIPINLFYDVVNIPYNEVQALDTIASSLLFAENWWVVGATNLWGIDPGDPTHVAAVLGWYFGYSTTPALAGLLGADTSYGQLHGFPFIPFGIAAFLILLLLTATSHDFWLAFLTPPAWKALHRLIYAAYALVAIHLALGQFQDARNPFFPVVAFGALVTVSGLHLAAALRTRHQDTALAPLRQDGWIDAGPSQAIGEGRAIVVALVSGEKGAIFRDDGRLSAVGNPCAHHNGPRGEGRVIDGCVTCPWHGYQYRLADGCAPPPFTERIATYNLRLDNDHVLLDPRPNLLGTPVEPLHVNVPAPVA